MKMGGEDMELRTYTHILLVAQENIMIVYSLFLISGARYPGIVEGPCLCDSQWQKQADVIIHL